ncbi:hypothetical protein [Pseudofrankia inefficax]|uniref:Uncharacterized protein n=1 Tax=Pseudofrankia inefficax (strain DSM 45817 / CECT 9037 / DDB 130130 / EuI1c) TaxID=298654 RepID=E3J1K3_PSEI1|nr:hypothetical protein [Pseudofrankia inefficax]ADP81671.1 hypothetical protein FraEuI1c_3664 [Pseudofrankia inefficax]
MSAAGLPPETVGGVARRPAATDEGPADVLHLKVEQDATPAGVSLGQGRALLAGMARLLQAAAMAVIGPAPRFAGRRPDVVKAFVEQDVRFAHTDAAGSLLAVFVRLDDDPPAAPDEPGRRSAGSWPAGPAAVRLAPFQRRAGVLTAGALVAVAEAVGEHRAGRRPAPPAGPTTPTAPAPGAEAAGRRAEALRPLVARGVSADLCDALLAMVTAPRVRTLEFSFYWAQRAGLDTPAVVRAALHRADADALARLRDELAALPEPRHPTAVYGQVTRLDRGDDGEGGVATIHGVVGRSTPRTVQVAVSGPEYDDAIHAYRTRTPVVATGRLLRRRGGIHVLTGRFSVATAIVGAGP